MCHPAEAAAGVPGKVLQREAASPHLCSPLLSSGPGLVGQEAGEEDHVVRLKEHIAICSATSLYTVPARAHLLHILVKYGVSVCKIQSVSKVQKSCHGPSCAACWLHARLRGHLHCPVAFGLLFLHVPGPLPMLWPLVCRTPLTGSNCLGLGSGWTEVERPAHKPLHPSILDLVARL